MLILLSCKLCKRLAELLPRPMLKGESRASKIRIHDDFLVKSICFYSPSQFLLFIERLDIKLEVRSILPHLERENVVTSFTRIIDVYRVHRVFLDQCRMKNRLFCIVFVPAREF